MRFSKTQQLALRAQKAIGLDACLRLDTLLNQFHKEKTFIDCCSKAIYSTSKRGQHCKSYLHPFYKKGTTLAHPFLQALHKSITSFVKIYITFGKKIKTKCCSLESIVNKLRREAKTLGLDFFKICHKLDVQLGYFHTNNAKSNTIRDQVSDEKIKNNAPHNGDILYSVEAKEKEKRNTTDVMVRFSKSINKQQCSHSRQLEISKNLYDNCKLKKSIGIFVDFSPWTIEQVFKDSLVQIMICEAIV